MCTSFAHFMVRAKIHFSKIMFWETENSSVSNTLWERKRYVQCLLANCWKPAPGDSTNLGSRKMVALKILPENESAFMSIFVEKFWLMNYFLMTCLSKSLFLSFLHKRDVRKNLQADIEQVAYVFLRHSHLPGFIRRCLVLCSRYSNAFLSLPDNWKSSKLIFIQPETYLNYYRAQYISEVFSCFLCVFYKHKKTKVLTV